MFYSATLHWAEAHGAIWLRDDAILTFGDVSMTFFQCATEKKKK